jgi:hypothetical protein
VGDRFFAEQVLEEQIRSEFLEIPQWKRKSIIVKCMERMPDNIHSWLASCIRNHRTSELAKRLENGASVHGSLPAAPRQKPGEPVGSVNIPWLHSQWSHMEGAEQTAWTSVSLLYGQGK